MAKKYLEFVGGSSSKFWEGSVSGTEMTVRYGRIGSDGTTKVKSFADKAKAKAAFDKLVAQKTKKGYAAAKKKPAKKKPAKKKPAKKPAKKKPAKGKGPGKAAASWSKLEKTLDELGLSSSLATSGARATRYSSKTVRKADPKPAQITRLLPDAYLAFVERFSYPMLLLPRPLGPFAFLPPPAMCQVSGAMGHPGIEWSKVRAAREAGKYTWEFVMFAGWDFADVNGWAFDEHGVVWLVEDSLPIEEHGMFEPWLVETVKERIAALRELDADELEAVRKEEEPYDYAPSDLSSF